MRKLQGLSTNQVIQVTRTTTVDETELEMYVPDRKRVARTKFSAMKGFPPNFNTNCFTTYYYF